MNKQQKITKYKIREIVKYFCLDIPANKTAILLKLNRKTVNRYYNVFREAIQIDRNTKLKKLLGDVELDESYFGKTRIKGDAKPHKRGRGTMKQPVFGIFKRNGEVYTEIVPDCKKATLRKIIQGKVDLKSIIYSDGWRGYNGLVDVGYDKHYRVNHGKDEFSKGNGIHINGIESFWSFTKRRLTKFNGVKVNFELHLKESEWRWSKSYKYLF
jgi:transposase